MTGQPPPPGQMPPGQMPPGQMPPPSPYPPGPPAAPPPGYPPAPQASVGVAGFILALVGLFICPPVGIVGAIMAGSAKKKARATGNPNTGLATAGQVIGYVFGILGTIGILLAILFLGVLGKAVSDESKAIGMTTDRFINNAASGNISGMQADSLAGMSRSELQDVSDYVESHVGTPTSINRTSTDINEAGSASVTVQITGSKGSATATFSLVRSGSDWKVKSVRVV